MGGRTRPLRDAPGAGREGRSLKVVQVTLRFDGPGGVETNVREVATRLRASGVDIEVYASDLVDESRWSRGTEFRPQVGGVPVRRFPAVRRSIVPHYSLPVMAGLVDALAASSADVIHAHSHRYGHVLQAGAVAERTGAAFVVSPHYHPADLGEPAGKRGLLRAEDALFGMAAYRRAEAIVVETELEARLVREFAPADRIRIIPPGIDLAEWRELPGRPPAELALPDRYFLFVGRLASNKGIPLLLEALAAIPAGPERLRLVLMGQDWGQRTALESQARSLGVADALRWLGHVEDRASYRSIVRGATALVLPSLWEAFGLVLLEAMAAGTPVVATAVGGVPEVLEAGHAGRLVPFGEPGALAEALRAVVADPGTTERLVARGKTRVGALDWSECARRHEELYRSVLADRRRSQ